MSYANGLSNGHTSLKQPLVLSGWSGRKVVGFGLLTIVLVLGVLFVVFLFIREDYKATAAYGRRTVPPIVDRWANLTPEGFDQQKWDDLVIATRLLVDRVSTLGLLDRDGLDALAADLNNRANGSNPAAALADLAGIWIDLEVAIGPRLGRVEVPEPIAEAVALGLMVPVIAPEVLRRDGIDPETAKQAASATRRMLAAVALSGRFDSETIKQIATELRPRSTPLATNPARLFANLNAIWDDIARRDPQALNAPGVPARPAALIEAARNQTNKSNQ